MTLRIKRSASGRFLFCSMPALIFHLPAVEARDRIVAEPALEFNGFVASAGFLSKFPANAPSAFRIEIYRSAIADLKTTSCQSCCSGRRHGHVRCARGALCPESEAKRKRGHAPEMTPFDPTWTLDAHFRRAAKHLFPPANMVGSILSLRGRWLSQVAPGLFASPAAPDERPGPHGLRFWDPLASSTLWA